MAEPRHDRRPRQRSGERHKSSRDRKRSTSDKSRRSPRDDRSRKPSPRERRRRSPSNDEERRPSSKSKRTPFFGRGRKPTRGDAKSFSLKRPNSRSTSRGTSRSRSTSREKTRPSYLQYQYWDPRKVHISHRHFESIGFAIPEDAPVASPRLDGQLYLSLSNLIGLASLASAVPSHLRSSAEVTCLTMQGLSFSVSLLTGVGLRYDPSRRRLTSPLFRQGTPLEHVSLETIINTLLLVLESILTGMSFTTPTLVNDTMSSIWNTNLYYSTLGGLSLASFLVADSYTADGTGVFWCRGHNFKPAAFQRCWALVLIGQIGLVAFCLEGLAGCIGGDCSQFSLGVSLGLVGALFSVGHFVIRIIETTKRIQPRGIKKIGLLETSCAAISFVLAAVNAAVLSDSKSSVNVYFACWVSFFLTLNLCLRYFEAYLSPGSMMNDGQYNNWAKKNAPPPKKNKEMMKRMSTGSTKSSHSSAFVARIEDAARAEAHLESMVASNDSSDPILYLDNKTGASPLSMDEEFVTQKLPALPPPLQSAQLKRDEPSVFVPQTGIDPQPSVSSTSQQRSVRALMPPSHNVPTRTRRLSIDPQESNSTLSIQDPPRAQLRRTFTKAPAPPPRYGRESSMEQSRPRDEPIITMFPKAMSEMSVSSASEYQRGPIKKRVGIAGSTIVESVFPSSESDSPIKQNFTRKDPMKQMHNRYESVQSMTGFIRQGPALNVPTNMSPVRGTDRKTGAANKVFKNSIISLFEEGSTKNATAAMAHVESSSQLPSEGSSPNTLDPPPTLEPSLSSKMRSQSPGIIKASPSIKSGRTSKSRQSISTKGSVGQSHTQSYASRARSRPSPGKSRTSSRAKSSTTHGSRGPPTLSEDGSGSRRTDRSAEPLTISDNEEDLVYNADLQESPGEYRPVRDISTDNFSIVSDPTMDGFDQSQRFDHSQSFEGSQRHVLNRMASTETLDEQISQSGTVDQMVMMALKQAYETRQQSLRQVGGDESSRGTKSSLQNIPLRTSDVDTRPKSTTATKRSNSSGFTASSGKSIRSFYSNNGDTNGDDSSAFAC